MMDEGWIRAGRDSDQNGEDGDQGTQTLVRPEVEKELEEPRLFRVVILNDDFTPRDFVVHILMHFFQKSESTANQLMLQVHTEGSGVAGIYPFEIAETKTFQVNNHARQNQFPLKCMMEEA